MKEHTLEMPNGNFGALFYAVSEGSIHCNVIFFLSFIERHSFFNSIKLSSLNHGDSLNLKKV